jgi:hypothetical protein
VDYQCSADAVTARTELFLNDKTGVHRAELGDARLTIAFKTEKPKEERKKPFWSGQLSMSGQRPVHVTALLVEGDCASVFSSFDHVAISHRAPATEVLMRDSVAVVVFSGISEEHRKTLAEFAEYFYSKQRAGFVHLHKHVMYVLPPGPESVRFASMLETDQLVGVLVANEQ